MRANGIRIARWVGIAMLAAALAACGSGRGDLEKWVAEVKAKPAPPLDPLPVMQQFETFEYAAQNLRDVLAAHQEHLPESPGMPSRTGDRRQTCFPRDRRYLAVLVCLCNGARHWIERLTHAPQHDRRPPVRKSALTI